MGLEERKKKKKLVTLKHRGMTGGAGYDQDKQLAKQLSTVTLTMVRGKCGTITKKTI